MRRIAIIVVIVVFSTACTVNTPVPTVTPTAIVAQPSPTISPAPPSTVVPTATPAPTLPPSPIFDIGWDDRTPFVAGLYPDRQSVLAELPGASIYHLAVTLAPDMTHVSGTESVRYTNTETTTLNAVVFRLFPNILGGTSTVSNVKVNETPAVPELSMQNSTMRVSLLQSLLPGEQVVISMNFAITVPTTVGRNYASFSYLDGILALPHFYPMIAVYDDEGWNAEVPPTYGDVVYADTGFYLAKITAPAGLTLVTSGVTIVSAVQGDAQTVTVAAGPMRDFYLAAGDFQRESQSVGQTTINSYAPADVTDANRQALGYVVSALQTFSGLVGEYPFTELDLVATPTTAGGIEYPGAIVLALGLYTPSNNFFEVAAVHETAHQWFYSLVGNDQIDDPWLDESLVQYLTWRFYREQYGKTGDAQMMQAMNGYWSRADKADIPIGLPVKAYSERDYGAIVYGRGPIFFHTLEDTIGTDPFDTFLRLYFQQYEWGIATPADLQSVAEDACGCNLTELFNEWVYPQ